MGERTDIEGQQENWESIIRMDGEPFSIQEEEKNRIGEKNNNSGNRSSIGDKTAS